MDLAAFANGIWLRPEAPRAVSMADLLSFPRRAFAAFYRDVLPAIPPGTTDQAGLSITAAKAVLLDFASRTAPSDSSVLVSGVSSGVERAACFYCADPAELPVSSTFAARFFGYHEFKRVAELVLPPAGVGAGGSELAWSRAWEPANPIHCYAALTGALWRSIQFLKLLAAQRVVPTYGVLWAGREDRDDVEAEFRAAGLPLTVRAEIALPATAREDASRLLMVAFAEPG